VVLEKIFKLKEALVEKKKLPRHVAFTIAGNIIWASKNKKSLEEAYKTGFDVLQKFISIQSRINIPIMTAFLLSEEMKESEHFPLFKDLLISFFNSLKESRIIHKNKVKISVLGKWYDLPHQLVESVKEAINETKDYDNFFLNFCVNYSGREEIVDSMRLIARKVKAGKLDPESISKDIIKENLYSSYFLPPDLIAVSGPKKNFSGLLLWDASDARIYFFEKNWPDLTKSDFAKAVEFYQKG